jgi:hypothetical protein
MVLTPLADARTAFERILTAPDPADLWNLQKALLLVDGEAAGRARSVARAFHACLRVIDSKSKSRSASRWGAALGTAAVASVSINELADTDDTPLHNLLQSGVPAVLEIGSALKSAHAWEIEAGLSYDEVAWFLYDELWSIAADARPELSPGDRRTQIDLVVDPMLDASISDADRAALVVDAFRAVLAARMAPVLAMPDPEGDSTA